MDAARRNGLVVTAVSGSYLTFSDEFALPELRFDRTLDPSADLLTIDARAHVRGRTVLMAVGHDRHEMVVVEGGTARVTGADTDRIKVERHPLGVEDLFKS